MAADFDFFRCILCCVPVSFSVELLDPALKSRFQEQRKGRETFGLEPRRSRPAPARLIGRAGLRARSPSRGRGGAGRGTGGAGPASQPLIGPCCRRPVLLSPWPLFPADSWGCSDLLAPLRPQPARVRLCSFFALSSSHPTRELPSAQPFSPFLMPFPPCTIWGSRSHYLHSVRLRIFFTHFLHSSLLLPHTSDFSSTSAPALQKGWISWFKDQTSGLGGFTRLWLHPAALIGWSLEQMRSTPQFQFKFCHFGNRAWWCEPLTPAAWEAEIGGF